MFVYFIAYYFVVLEIEARHSATKLHGHPQEFDFKLGSQNDSAAGGASTGVGGGGPEAASEPRCDSAEGGLEELVEELNSGKVMYAFCRVKDPNSGLPKFVLINWVCGFLSDTRRTECVTAPLWRSQNC